MLRLNSFGVKLMLALGLTVVIAVGSVALAINRVASRQFTTYVTMGMMNRADAVAPLMADYYSTQGGWEGVAEYLEDLTSPATPGHGPMGMMRGRGGPAFMGGAGLILADADGRVLVDDATGTLAGEVLSAGGLADSVPVVAGGRTVGYLAVGKGPLEIAFEERLDRSILYAGLAAGVVALVLGAMLTRAVLQPLRVVSEGARRVGAGDLAHRVPVTSSDEIGDLARRFNEMAADLERQEALRQAMVADIAHELRTPLAVIRAQVEALQDGVFDYSEANLRPIHDQVLLLGRLVDDLRELALAEAGRLRLERSELDPRELVDRALTAFLADATESGVALSAVVAPDVPSVEGDPQRLEQVLGNLLSNAIRHTGPGGSVAVRVSVEGEWVAIAVEDSGSGIAPADLPHVFDRFYRADPARSKADGGTGLGLSIAKRLVEAHGGSVSVASAPGEGSTFTVRLPGRRAVAPRPA